MEIGVVGEFCAKDVEYVRIIVYMRKSADGKLERKRERDKEAAERRRSANAPFAIVAVGEERDELQEKKRLSRL